MFNSKFNTLLTTLLIIAIIAIIAIIGYFGYSIYNRYYLNAGAQDAVDAFEEAVGNTNTVTPPQTNVIVDENVVIGGVSEGNNIYQDPAQNGGTNTSPTTYYGYNVIGTISIPAIDIEYPILDSPSTNALNVATVYLSGPGINQVGNTVIQGHNYRNGLFFSNLSKLSVGDKIYIRDTSGTQITYEVYRNFEAQATDTSFYRRDTQGKREITLSTCTNDNKVRTIILAREV